jgi:succinylglutamate desuccinylase
VVDKAHADDTFCRAWSSFDPLRTGDLIGHREDGTPVLAQEDGYIVFPNAGAPSGQEWYYLAKANQRLEA